MGIKQSVMDLLTSKKFKMAVFGVLGLVCSHYGADIPWSEVTEKSWAIVLAYLASQGVSDLGKGRFVEEVREFRRREIERQREGFRPEK